jgi:hypothetical protein
MMIRASLFALFAAALLAACPKDVPNTTIAGSDDERMDVYAAQLEELRTKTDLTCSDFCSLKGKVCDLGKNICEISNAKADRTDFQSHCIAAQEECARYNEQCSSCSAK